MKAFLKGLGSGSLDVIGVLLGILALSIYPLFPESMLPAASQLFLIGIVLILGAFAGHIASRCALPRITGYILIGIVINPTLPAVLPDLNLPVLIELERTKSLALINDLAIGLIALMAGAEIRLVWLRARLKSILTITLVSTLMIPALIGGFLLIAPSIGIGDIPFVKEAIADGVPGWAIAALVGAILLANSPTVVVSVLKEMRAEGPMGQTVMGVSVIMDAVVILLFTVLLALIAVMSAGASENAPSLLQASGAVAGSIIFSIVVGGFIGYGLKHYTEWSDHRLSWTLVGLSLAAASLGPLVHIKPLFCLLAAGFACENISVTRTELGSHRLESALNRVANPVFVVFFVVAGMLLDLQALANMWLLVLIVSLVRLVSVVIAVWVGARLSKADPTVPRYGWIGLVSQAGVTLALVPIVAGSFPGWGKSLATFVVAMVAFHQIVGPAAFAWAVKRTGEAGKAIQTH